jgi:Zn-dependent protease with chaperone function
MPTAPSFTGRIIMALLLMVGFYLLAVTIALVLFYIPYAEVRYAGRLHIKLALGCVIGGALILWSVLPRFDRFTAPGPRLTPEDQPELFAQLESIAQATEQAMPAEVYAVPEMNAWVANRGGVMGLGSRRVMGLGVPLMQILSVQQFRGVLAHEFGHYYGGDTKLGPWIYVTRSAIMRTVGNLASDGSSVLSKPFEWYGQMFLKITQSVSRHQEYVADAMGAKVAGAQALIDGLKVIHSSAPAFDAYWRTEYAPVLGSGFRAPLVEGFEAFFTSPQIKETTDKLLAHELESGQSNPYDSHPALKDRIAALQKLPASEVPANDPPFLSLLRKLDQLELRMIEHLAAAVKDETPRSIGWSEVCEKVWSPFWQKSTERNAPLLGEATVLEAGRATEQPQDVVAKAKKLLGDGAPDDAYLGYWWQAVQMAFCGALARDGWTLSTPIGKPVLALRNGQELEPFGLFDELSQKKITLAEFESRCTAAGVGGLRLVAAAA